LSSLVSRRGFLHVYLPEFDLNVINTHLSAGFSKHPRYSPVRFLQVKQLKEYVLGYDKVIFGGDFNFYENSPEHNLIKKHSIDLSDGVGNTFPRDKAKYDYIFSHQTDPFDYNSSLVTWHEQTIFFQRQPIDHAGIMTKIFLDKNQNIQSDKVALN